VKIELKTDLKLKKEFHAAGETVDVPDEQLKGFNKAQLVDLGVEEKEAEAFVKRHEEERRPRRPVTREKDAATAKPEGRSPGTLAVPTDAKTSRGHGGKE
jgi:hypothetical protein